MSSLISIIVPVYNIEDKLSRCIESLLNQTYKNIEVIIIDDGSTDGSFDICNKFRYDSRVNVIYKQNGGVSSARNKGLDIAKGKYLCFVDGDDYIDEKYIENMYNEIQDNIDLVVCNYYTYDCQSTEYEESRIEGKEYSIEDIINNYWHFFHKGLINAPWNKMYKADIIKENNINFPIDLSMGEDGYFVNSYLMHSKRIRVIDDILYTYYIYPGQSSKKVSIDYFNMMDKNFEKIEKLISKKYIRKNNNNLETNHIEEYFKVVKESIRNIVLDNKYDICYKKYKISEVCNNYRTINLIRKYEPRNFQESILKKLIIKKNINLITYIYIMFYRRRF